MAALASDTDIVIHPFAKVSCTVKGVVELEFSQPETNKQTELTKKLFTDVALPDKKQNNI